VGVVVLNKFKLCSVWDILNKSYRCKGTKENEDSLSFLFPLAIFVESFIIRSYESIKEPLHIDEAFQIAIYKLNFFDAIKSGAGLSRHPPLDFIIGWAVNKLPFENSYIFRLPNVIFGCLFFVLIYFILVTTFTRNLAFVLTLVLSFWGPSIVYSSYVRPYSSFLFLFIFCIYLIVFLPKNFLTNILTLLFLVLLSISRGIDGLIASSILVISMMWLSKFKNNLLTVSLSIGINLGMALFLKNLFLNNDPGVIGSNNDFIYNLKLGLLDFFNLATKFSYLYFALIIAGLVVLIFPKRYFRLENINTFKLFFVITLSQLLINFILLRTLTTHGIYNRYFVMFLPLIISCITLILLSNIFSSRKMKTAFLVLVIFVFGTSGFEEIRIIKNLPFDQINKSYTNSSSIVYLEGSDNQYLPGWPQTPGIQVEYIPNWIPYYIRSNDFSNLPNKLIILPRVDQEFGFLVDLPFESNKYLFLGELGELKSITNGLIFHPNSITDFKIALESLINDLPQSESRWLKVLYLNLFKDKSNYVRPAFDVCEFIGGNDKVELGPVFGQWGERGSWTDFISEAKEITKECSYAR
jgi:hypothetical protein